MREAQWIRGNREKVGNRGGKQMWCSASGVQCRSLCLVLGNERVSEELLAQEEEDWLLRMLRAFNCRGSCSGEGGGAKYSNS